MHRKDNMCVSNSTVPSSFTYTNIVIDNAGLALQQPQCNREMTPEQCSVKSDYSEPCLVQNIAAKFAHQCFHTGQAASAACCDEWRLPNLPVKVDKQ